MSSRLSTLEVWEIFVQSTVALRRQQHLPSFRTYRAYKNCHLEASSFVRSVYKKGYISQTTRPMSVKFSMLVAIASYLRKPALTEKLFFAAHGPFSCRQSHNYTVHLTMLFVSSNNASRIKIKTQCFAAAIRLCYCATRADLRILHTIHHHRSG